ncbi:MAG TPA: hypothetical protein VGV61_13125 [Thermoanaerobaculia bacterium]|jgi:hypothetical protein|nr:hypothetical protein [Thermoanaerobaculia bacterium]
MADDAAPPPHAIAELLGPLCSAVLLLRVSGKVEIGSSTLVRVGERFLLATAAHTVDDARDEEIRLVPCGRSPAAPLPFLRRSVRRRSDPDDVAWVELAAETVANRGLGFVELACVGGNGGGGDELCYLVQGYPAERVLAVGWNGASLQAMGFVTLAARGRAGDLAVLYPPPESGEWPPPHPYGISGGGIWRLARSDVTPWRRGTRLVAIARGWRRRRGTLHGTPIERWLARVADDLPALRGAVLPLLKREGLDGPPASYPATSG